MAKKLSKELKWYVRKNIINQNQAGKEGKNHKTANKEKTNHQR